MQVCGHGPRRRTGIGHVALWFPAVGHLAVDCCSHTLSQQAKSIGYIVFFIPYATRHKGVFALLRQRFHGSQRIIAYQDDSKLLEIRFCQPHVFPQSSLSFWSVWLLLVRPRDISPSLSLARVAYESQRVPFLHLLHFLEPIAITLLFVPSFMPSLGSNRVHDTLLRLRDKIPIWFGCGFRLSENLKSMSEFGGCLGPYGPPYRSVFRAPL